MAKFANICKTCNASKHRMAFEFSYYLSKLDRKVNADACWLNYRLVECARVMKEERNERGPSKSVQILVGFGFQNLKF